jgi:uncharacterized protein YndB with AHSA1/START domain
MNVLHAKRIAPGTIRLERLLPGPIERVWSYIADGEKRASWFAGGPVEPRAGGTLDWTFDHAALSREKDTPEKHKGSIGHRFQARVERWEPPHAFAWHWGEELVTFELEERGQNVLMTITHQPVPEAQQADVSAAWDTHTGVLDDVLSGARPRGFWSTHERLEQAYKGEFEKN